MTLSNGTLANGTPARILSRRAGTVGEIVLNHPARHNAISIEMWERLAEALAEAAEDSSVRVLVVCGAGKNAFAGGADTSMLGAETGDADAMRHYSKLAGETAEALYNFPKPTIGKINGTCVGAGLNLAVCCDMRIAAADAAFCVPGARLGIGYAFADVRRLADAIGLPMALELFFTARRVASEEALRIGLVNRVVPAADLDDVVAETARTICENAPLTIAGIKAMARELSKPAAKRDLARLERVVETCFASQDFAEGRLAYMEKRKPDFSGT